MGSVEQEVLAGRADLPSAYRSDFRIGGISVQVVGKTGRDVSLVASLEPFRTSTRASDIQVEIEWAETLAPASGPRLFDSGSVWQLFQDDENFLFDFHASVLGPRPYKRLLVDKEFRSAKLRMSTPSFAGKHHEVVPLEYPLDELLIMHRLTQERAIELHSCGIMRDDGSGELFVGHSGAGKSTTTRLWTSCQDAEVLSDDRIIVRRDASSLTGLRMYGTPWHGEARFASPRSAPLAHIFILQHGQGNLLTRLSPSQAVAELFARSFVPFHRHEYVDCALQFLQEVAASVPIYRYAFEPDQRAVDTILNLHE